MSRIRSRSVKGTILTLLVLGLFWLAQSAGLFPLPAGEEKTGAGAGGDGAAVIAEAFRDRRSDVPVEGSGIVRKTLPDDDEGSAHQRFILELAGGATVLVAHNIDLAPRVPLDEGDRVEFKGEYEWNDRGGVVHWTHHDPRGSREGGWLRHDGRTYE